MKTIKVCAQCGSANLLWDAFVHANDSEDVRIFDNLYCAGCNTPDPGYREMEVEEDFDIYEDNYFDLTQD